MSEHANEHVSEQAAIRAIAEKMGCSAERLRLWVRRSERDCGVRPGLSAGERDRLKALERENRELRQARDFAEGWRLFCSGGVRPPVQAMFAFIDDHRALHGVEPICRELPIATSTHHAATVRRAEASSFAGEVLPDHATYSIHDSRFVLESWSTSFPHKGLSFRDDPSEERASWATSPAA